MVYAGVFGYLSWLDLFAIGCIVTQLTGSRILLLDEKKAKLTRKILPKIF